MAKINVYQIIILLFRSFGSLWLFVESTHAALSIGTIGSRFGGLRGSS